MENQIVETLATLLRELQKYGTADNVIGKELHIGDVTIVPITKISLGVGAGGGTGGEVKNKKPEERSGGGGGGGLKVEPIAFLVVQKGQVSLLSIGKKGPLDAFSEQIPALINRWIDKQTSAGKKAESNKSKEQTTKKDGQSELSE